MSTAPIEETHLRGDLLRLLQLKQQKAEIENEIEYLQTALCALQFDSTLLETDDGNYRATVVRSESFDVNTETLQAKYPELWAKVTKVVFDQKKFVNAVQSGDVDEAIVREAVNIKQRTPFIKLTQIQEEGNADE